MMKVKRFSDVFQNADELKSQLASQIPLNEVAISENWFIPFVTVFNNIYDVFLAKTFGKVFIWPDENNEIDIMIKGRFIPLLWSETYNFYLKQLGIMSGDLNELKDWKLRGSQETGTKNLDETKTQNTTGEVTTSDLTNGATSRYSQPTASGYLWDNEIDAPTSKIINDDKATSNTNQDLSGTNNSKEIYDKNINNRLNDLQNIFLKNVNIYFENIFCKFEKFFIDANKVKGAEYESNFL